MAFARPTLATLITRVGSDIGSRLPAAQALLRRAMTTILGRVVAGAVHGLYGHQEYIARQILVDTCDADVLARHAATWKVPRKGAAAATGPVLLTGNNGSVLPSGSLLTRADGNEYATTADATIVAGVASVNVVASLAGAAGNAQANTQLSFVAPQAGISAVATVDAAGLGAGADIEDVEAWRLRVIKRVQQGAKGGVSADYLEWALSVAGVTRAWVYPKELGLGTVSVRVVTDDAPGGLIPDAATISAVQAYIESVCPVEVELFVVAPVAAPINFTLHLVPDNLATRAAVQGELAALIARQGQPGGTILITDIEEAIKTASGVTDYVLTAPAANVAETTGNIPTMGVVTWV